MATILHNRYRIDDLLGQGAMGVVYRGYDLLLNRTVAIKELSNTNLSPVGKARLLSEAQAAAKLNHPNIVTVHDAGETEGVPFIVMELVPGETLREHKTQNLKELVDMIVQVCQALEHAHAAGIIHRDLKPENIKLTPSGTVKLMDFGLARSNSDPKQTEEGAVIGTFQYIAPELLMGDPPSPQSDLYALGAMFYELACGQPLFKGDNLSALIGQHLQAEPARPSGHNPLISAEMDALILRLLAKQPADRPASAAEVRSVLEQGGGLVEVRAGTAPKHNLPRQLTSFIGREREVEQLVDLLKAQPLVTVTGAGGTGKTRLALKAAEQVLDEFADGVYLVELAPLSDPQLVAQACVQALELMQPPNVLAETVLLDNLKSRHAVLILDNCEHILDACASLANVLLKGCPKLHVLATSREILSVPGETAFRVPSLSFPEQGTPPMEDLLYYEAIELLVERARQVSPDFKLSDENAGAVVQICRRLDGIPLAIELAAARMRLLSVEQLAARLDNTFRLLTGGSKAVLPRQQTLKAMIDWSYNLLSPQERLLLQRLSVFAGGWTLEAAEAVCADCADRADRAGEGQIDTFEVLDLLGQLADKSLVNVWQAEGEARYRMLETVRQYGRDRLLETGGSQITRDRHLAYFANLSGLAEPHLRGKGQIVWLKKLEEELENLRLAMEWSLISQIELGLKIAVDTMWFWHMRAIWPESFEWLERLLEAEQQQRAGQALTGERALQRARGLRAMTHQSVFLLNKPDSERVILMQESVAILRGLQPLYLRELGISLYYLLYRQQMLDIASPLREEMFDLLTRTNEMLYLSEYYLYSSGYGESLDEVFARKQASLALSRKIEDADGIARCCLALGSSMKFKGDYAQAESLIREGIEIGRGVNRWYAALFVAGLGQVYLAQGKYEEARQYQMQALKIWQELNFLTWTSWPLLLIQIISWSEGNFKASLREGEQQLGAFPGQLGSAMDVNIYLGRAAISLGDRQQAQAYLRAAITCPLLDGGKDGWDTTLPHLISWVALCCLQGRYQAAARLSGAVDGIYRQVAAGLAPRERSEFEENQAAARAALGEDAFAQAFREGKSISLNQSIAWVRQNLL
jgi:predicted ATPase